MRLEPSYGLFVGGEWRTAAESFTTISPADEEPLAAGRAGERGGRRRRRRRRARRVRGRLERPAAGRAGEVPVPDRAAAAGARARVRRARVARRRQADQGVARRRPAARRRALLLLRGLGGQARVRVPEPAPAPGRGRRPGDPVELPAADAGVEGGAGARGGEHGRAQAGRDDAAHRAAVLRRPAPGGAARRAWSTSSPATGRPAPRSSRTPTSTRSPSPARPRSARRSSASSPAAARG